MPSKNLLKCAECLNEFKGPFSQKFCSQNCAKESRKVRKKMITCRCGKEFEVHVQASSTKLCNDCNHTNDKVYHCKFCEKSFQTKSSLYLHVNVAAKKFNNNHIITFEDYSNDGARKRFLLRESGHICWICKNYEWMGKPIPLELDHINGRSDDSSKKNLRILCPNCHAQTSTYKAKNKGNGSKHRVLMYESMKLRASMRD